LTGGRSFMNERPKLKDVYGLVETSVPTFPSGSTVLDCALGGGWAQGRVVNVVGDSATGKTLLAIEACASYHRQYPGRRVRYVEAEAAFDANYAEAVGFPVDAVELQTDVRTVEDLAKDLDTFLNRLKEGEGALYVLDSLDGLSDEKELGRAVGEDSYAMTKAKGLSELFRKMTTVLELKRVTLFIVSQVRDNVGVVYGKKDKRAGGRALQFYCSQVVWLNTMGKIERTRSGIKRVVGVKVRAKVDKNRIGPAFREAEFPLMFGYGVDDASSMLDWLEEHKGLSADAAKQTATELSAMDDADYFAELGRIAVLVKERWNEVEAMFRPERTKRERP